MFCVYLFSMVISVIGKGEEIYDDEISGPAGNNQRAQMVKTLNSLIIISFEFYIWSFKENFQIFAQYPTSLLE